MNGCGKYEVLIARYLDGEALLPDREALEKHLAAVTFRTLGACNGG